MISRRSILGAIGVGSAMGLVSSRLLRSQPSLRLIGRGSAIICLLDTGNERLLLVLGEPDTTLLSNVVGLTTIGNSRIDLVVASHGSLATLDARKHLKLDSTSAISIQSNPSLPVVTGDVIPVTQATTLELGGDTLISIQPASLSLSGMADDHPDFLVTTNCNGVSLVLASSAPALRLGDGSVADVLVLPGSPSVETLSLQRAQVFVVNWAQPGVETGAQVQVYPADPVSIRLENGTVRLRDDQVSS